MRPAFDCGREKKVMSSVGPAGRAQRQRNRALIGVYSAVPPFFSPQLAGAGAKGSGGFALRSPSKSSYADGAARNRSTSTSSTTQEVQHSRSVEFLGPNSTRREGPSSHDEGAGGAGDDDATMMGPMETSTTNSAEEIYGARNRNSKGLDSDQSGNPDLSASTVIKPEGLGEVGEDSTVEGQGTAGNVAGDAAGNPHRSSPVLSSVSPAKRGSKRGVSSREPKSTQNSRSKLNTFSNLDDVFAEYKSRSFMKTRNDRATSTMVDSSTVFKRQPGTSLNSHVLSGSSTSSASIMSGTMSGTSGSTSSLNPPGCEQFSSFSTASTDQLEGPKKTTSDLSDRRYQHISTGYHVSRYETQQAFQESLRKEREKEREDEEQRRHEEVYHSHMNENAREGGAPLRAAGRAAARSLSPQLDTNTSTRRPATTGHVGFGRLGRRRPRQYRGMTRDEEMVKRAENLAHCPRGLTPTVHAVHAHVNHANVSFDRDGRMVEQKQHLLAEGGSTADRRVLSSIAGAAVGGAGGLGMGVSSPEDCFDETAGKDEGAEQQALFLRATRQNSRLPEDTARQNFPNVKGRRDIVDTQAPAMFGQPRRSSGASLNSSTSTGRKRSSSETAATGGNGSGNGNSNSTSTSGSMERGAATSSTRAWNGAQFVESFNLAGHDSYYPTPDRPSTTPHGIGLPLGGGSALGGGSGSSHRRGLTNNLTNNLTNSRRKSQRDRQRRNVKKKLDRVGQGVLPGGSPGKLSNLIAQASQMARDMLDNDSLNVQSPEKKQAGPMMPGSNSMDNERMHGSTTSMDNNIDVGDDRMEFTSGTGSTDGVFGGPGAAVFDHERNSSSNGTGSASDAKRRFEIRLPGSEYLYKDRYKDAYKDAGPVYKDSTKEDHLSASFGSVENLAEELESYREQAVRANARRVSVSQPTSQQLHMTRQKLTQRRVNIATELNTFHSPAKNLEKKSSSVLASPQLDSPEPRAVAQQRASSASTSSTGTTAKDAKPFSNPSGLLGSTSTTFGPQARPAENFQPGTNMRNLLTAGMTPPPKGKSHAETLQAEMNGLVSPSKEDAEAARDEKLKRFFERKRKKFYQSHSSSVQSLGSAHNSSVQSLLGGRPQTCPDSSANLSGKQRRFRFYWHSDKDSVSKPPKVSLGGHHNTSTSSLGEKRVSAAAQEKSRAEAHLRAIRERLQSLSASPEKLLSPEKVREMETEVKEMVRNARSLSPRKDTASSTASAANNGAPGNHGAAGNSNNKLLRGSLSPTKNPNHAGFLRKRYNVPAAKKKQNSQSQKKQPASASASASEDESTTYVSGGETSSSSAAASVAASATASKETTPRGGSKDERLLPPPTTSTAAGTVFFTTGRMDPRTNNNSAARTTSSFGLGFAVGPGGPLPEPFEFSGEPVPAQTRSRAAGSGVEFASVRDQLYRSHITASAHMSGNPTLSSAFVNLNRPSTTPHLPSNFRRGVKVRGSRGGNVLL